MKARLTPREQTLALLVGGLFVAIISFFLITFFVRNHRQLKTDLAVKAQQLTAMQSLFSDKDLWAERETWLNQRQPALKNEGTAGIELLDEIKLIAKKTNVQLTKQDFGTIQRRPHYTSVPVSIELKAPASAMRDFLFEMQSPDRFIVFETANLQFDSEDKTQMSGKFTIAKWFAPTAGAPR